MGKPNHNADIKNHNNTTLDKNNDTYKKATDNHANELNKNNWRYQNSKKDVKTTDTE